MVPHQPIGGQLGDGEDRLVVQRQGQASSPRDRTTPAATNTMGPVIHHRSSLDATCRPPRPAPARSDHPAQPLCLPTNSWRRGSLVTGSLQALGDRRLSSCTGPPLRVSPGWGWVAGCAWLLLHLLYGLLQGLVEVLGVNAEVLGGLLLGLVTAFWMASLTLLSPTTMRPAWPGSMKSPSSLARDRDMPLAMWPLTAPTAPPTAAAPRTAGANRTPTAAPAAMPHQAP